VTTRPALAEFLTEARADVRHGVRAPSTINELTLDEEWRMQWEILIAKQWLEENTRSVQQHGLAPSETIERKVRSLPPIAPP
jgi:hypothetical protein